MKTNFACALRPEYIDVLERFAAIHTGGRRCEALRRILEMVAPTVGLPPIVSAAERRRRAAPLMAWLRARQPTNGPYLRAYALAEELAMWVRTGEHVDGPAWYLKRGASRSLVLEAFGALDVVAAEAAGGSLVE